jgi:flagellar basal-body rod protein FlgF
MDSLIDSAAAIMRTESQRVETLAQNLANLATPGYKQVLPFQSALRSSAAEGKPLQSYVDHRPGALVADGDPLHVAIAGPGWFEVSTPGGGPAYTRHGAFRVDERGRLVSAGGHAVQLDGGTDANFKGRAVRIAADGTLIEDGRAVGRLRILDFPERTALTKAADGLFRAARGGAQELAEPVLHLGAVEASNVSTADSMVRLMEAMRRAEMSQKLVHAYDDMLGRALRQSGE